MLVSVCIRCCVHLITHPTYTHCGSSPLLKRSHLTLDRRETGYFYTTFPNIFEVPSHFRMHSLTFTTYTWQRFGSLDACRATCPVSLLLSLLFLNGLQRFRGVWSAWRETCFCGAVHSRQRSAIDLLRSARASRAARHITLPCCSHSFCCSRPCAEVHLCALACACNLHNLSGSVSEC